MTLNAPLFALVFVAALGHPFGPNTERGVFRTTDGGKTWDKVLYKDENTGAIDVAFDPQNPNILFASLWEARRNLSPAIARLARNKLGEDVTVRNIATNAGFASTNIDDVRIGPGNGNAAD